MRFDNNRRSKEGVSDRWSGMVPRRDEAQAQPSIDQGLEQQFRFHVRAYKVA